MSNQHRLITELAQSSEIAGALHQTAAKIAGRAENIDRQADCQVEDGQLVVDGLPRKTAYVRNVAPDAAAREFGPRGIRALGRAAGAT